MNTQLLSSWDITTPERVLQAARTRAAQELQRSKGTLADTLEAITRLENGLADASTKFGFLQEIRAYVSDLCDMLQVMIHLISTSARPS